MLKKLIAPLQDVLISKRFCPGCTRGLDDQSDRKMRHDKKECVTCECGRIYIHDTELEIYRRALVNELEN